MNRAQTASSWDRHLTSWRVAAQGVAGGNPPSAPPPQQTVRHRVPPAPRPSVGSPPPRVPAPPSGGNGSGGSTKDPSMRMAAAVLLAIAGILLVILILSFINDYFVGRALESAAKYKQMTSTASDSQPQPGSHSVRQEFLATRKQAMIDHCGRRTESMEYRLDLGCFFFDNAEGAVGKEVILLVRDSLRTVELDGNQQPIKIIASDGSSCEISKGDSCSYWIRERSGLRSEGLAKFSLRVPAGGAFIANITKGS